MPSSVTTPRRKRLHLVYFALATFDVLAVCSGLYLSHRFMTIYMNSVDVNRGLAGHVKEFAKLSQLAQEANAPGNDVFDSRDVKLERARRDQAIAAFDTQIAAMRASLPIDTTPQLGTAFEKVQTAMKEMAAEAEAIFTFFESGEPDKAGARMATMDRKYAILTGQVGETTAIIQSLQDEHFSQQLAEANGLRNFEYIIGSALVLMVCFVLLYGHKIGRMMNQSDDEIRNTNARLQAANEALSSLNNELALNARRVQSMEDDKQSMSQRSAKEQAELISTLGAALDNVARGNLVISLEVRPGDPYGQIKADFNTAVDHLRNTLSVILKATQEVAAAAGGISASAQELAAGTGHQATALEQTSASMEQMTAVVLQNSQHARRAAKAAVSARDAALEGGRRASDAGIAIDRIDSSAHRINEIISVIEEIAFQTNILALNAAVEAARAGEMGKGFGVVAGEVRALSQRSASALKDIKSIIQKSNSDVRSGVQLVKDANTSLVQIVGLIKNVAELVSDIETSSREQTVNIEHVTNAVTGLDSIIQKNAEIVEDTNAALEAAQSQIDGLRKEVTKFRTGDGSRLAGRHIAA